MLAVSTASYFLTDRDEFIKQMVQAVERANPTNAAAPSPSPQGEVSPSPEASPSPTPAPAVAKADNSAEQMAGMLYDKRGVWLPLAAISLILNLLLLLGCLRALRGSAWGASAWSTACSVLLPFQVLRLAVAVLELPQPAVLFTTGAGALYCVAVIVYLRKP